MSTGRPRLAIALALALALALATLAAYSGAFGLGFAYDDADYVVRNRHLAAGFTRASLAWAFSSFYAANWHPLAWISHLIDVQLFGLRPAGHHGTSVLLHVANTLLLFLVLCRYTGARGRSAFVAGLFALHPLHVESVAWVAERKDVLSTFFGLAALAGYERYVRRPSRGRYAAAAALVALSLMTKPMLVTLPLVLLLFDWWPLGRLTAGGRRPWALVAEKIPLFVLAAGSSLVTLAAQAGGGALASTLAQPLSARLGNALVSLMAYIGKTLWPKGLAAFYPLPGAGHQLWRVVAAGIALAAVTAVVLAARRDRPFLAFGWLLYLVALLPVIGVVQVGSQRLADRYTYLPLVGLFIAATWTTSAVGGRRAQVRRPLIAAGLVLLLCLGSLTLAQVAFWRDDLTLFAHAAAVTDDNAVAHHNLGLVLSSLGRFEEAQTHLAEALRIWPEAAPIHLGLGNLLTKRGDLDAAVRELRRALELDPALSEARVSLGLVLKQRGEFAEAELQYRAALQRSPGLAGAHMNLGNLLSDLGDERGAVASYLQAQALSPGDPLIRYNLAVSLERLGRLTEAAAGYQEALRLRPGFAEAADRLARLRTSGGVRISR